MLSLIRVLSHSQTRVFTHSLANSRTHSLTHSQTRVLTHSLTRVLKSSLNLTFTYLPSYSLTLSPANTTLIQLRFLYFHSLTAAIQPTGYTYSYIALTHNCNPTNRIHIFIYRTHSHQCTHNTYIHSNIVWRSTSKVYNCIMHPFSN